MKEKLFEDKDSEKYNSDLKVFFDKTSKEEFAVETILLGYIPNDFATRENAYLKTFFYNVQFMGKKWKGIEIQFGTDKNRRSEWKALKIGRASCRERV